jgi:hypothetical protein
MMFMPGRDVLSGQGTAHFTNAGEAKVSPLARALFRVPGVKEILLGGDFLTIVKVCAG